MTTSARTRVRAVLLSTILTVLTINSLIVDGSVTSYLHPVVLDANNNGIGDVTMEFSRGRIHLNVELLRPLTCKDVVSALNITTLPLKGKTYFPSCTAVNANYIRITYSEVTPV